jgi:16S rRNA (cytidine(1402)-2'-O)-methyltransferase
MIEKGRLYIVATPIGNPRDITLRALDVLAGSGCRCVRRIPRWQHPAKKAGDSKKDHPDQRAQRSRTSTADRPTAASKKALALISDCGTPVFADPGATLINVLTEQGIPVVPIPGPSSLMAALSVLSVKLDRFLYAGFYRATAMNGARRSNTCAPCGSPSLSWMRRTASAPCWMIWRQYRAAGRILPWRLISPCRGK